MCASFRLIFVECDIITYLLFCRWTWFTACVDNAQYARVRLVSQLAHSFQLLHGAVCKSSRFANWKNALAYLHIQTATQKNTVKKYKRVKCGGDGHKFLCWPTVLSLLILCYFFGAYCRWLVVSHEEVSLTRFSYLETLIIVHSGIFRMSERGGNPLPSPFLPSVPSHPVASILSSLPLPS